MQSLQSLHSWHSLQPPKGHNTRHPDRNMHRFLSHSQAPRPTHCRRSPPRAALQQPFHQCGGELLRLLEPPHDLSTPLPRPRRAACCRFDFEDALKRLERESLSGYRDSVRLPRGAVKRSRLSAYNKNAILHQSGNCSSSSVLQRCVKDKAQHGTTAKPCRPASCMASYCCADGIFSSHSLSSDNGVALSRTSGRLTIIPVRLLPIPASQ